MSALIWELGLLSDIYRIAQDIAVWVGVGFVVCLCVLLAFKKK